MARILVVSADPAFRASARRRAGRHHLIATRNETAGARLLERTHFDLVCLDTAHANGNGKKTKSFHRFLNGTPRVDLKLRGRKKPGARKSPELSPRARRAELLAQLESAIAELSHRRRQRGARPRRAPATPVGDGGRLAFTLGLLREGVVLTDRRGHPTVLNESAREMLGCQPAAKGDSPSQGPGLEFLLKLIKDASDSEEERTSTRMFRSGLAPLQVLVAPRWDPDGAPAGAVAILEEETPSREELKNGFIARVSHELKTPLASIRAASDVIAQARIGSLNEKQEKMLRIISQETGNLVCLIEDLLNVAEIESGRIRLRCQRCALSDIARASLENFRNKFEEKGVLLLDSLSQAHPSIHADAERIRQVFDNLLSNALKFTPPRGRVEVKLSTKLKSRNGSGPVLLASVSDSGIGISRADLEHVFDKFHQIENWNTRTTAGTGLGLAISKFLVEAHGGELWAKSRTGTGSTFFFTIPVAR